MCIMVWCTCVASLRVLLPEYEHDLSNPSLLIIMTLFGYFHWVLSTKSTILPLLQWVLKWYFLLFIDNKRWFNTNLVQHLIRSMYLIWILSPAHHKLQYKILLEMWSFSSYFVKLRVFHQSCPMPRKNASIAMHSGTAAQLVQPLLQLRHRTSK